MIGCGAHGREAVRERSDQARDQVKVIIFVGGKWPDLPKPLLQGEVARRRRDGEVVQRRACPL